MVAAPLILLLSGALHLSGDVTCPTVPEVEARLKPLLPAEEQADRTQHRVQLLRVKGALVLSLEDESGQPLATRSLAAEASCADLAAAAAVVIATWEVELRGRGALGLWLEPRTLPPPVLVAPAPARPWEVGLALFAGGARGGGFAPAGVLSLGFAGLSGRWAVDVGLLGVGAHTASLPPGEARWWRLGLSLGAQARVTRGVWRGAAGMRGVVSYLDLVGRGFPADRAVHTVDPGGGPEVRVGIKTAGLVTWVGATLIWWPIGRDLLVLGESGARSLPQVEGLVGLGVEWSSHP